ncbi:hypothetical protein [Streptomyces sp. NPDC048188]|uniref:hypothetical protein n=1 Tax=Streptomyces sp. NPDC048188 TaxID=3155749 RepID=UPI0034143ECB
MSRAPSTMQWIRQAGQRIATGSARLATLLAARALHAARRLWQRAEAWLGDPFTVGWLLRLAVLLAIAAVVRKVALAAGGGLYAAVADGRAPWLMWGGAGLWVVAAYRCGRDGWAPRRTAETPGDAEQLPDAEQQDDQEAAAQTPAGPPPVSPVALIAAVRDVGTPHAQLKPLAEHLATTTDAVRAAAAGMGWPVKDVRMAGRSASAGLRWDECPSPPPTDPSPGVVGAGERADDNDDDTHEEGPREGIAVRRTDGGLVIYDLADRHRRRGIVGR